MGQNNLADRILYTVSFNIKNTQTFPFWQDGTEVGFPSPDTHSGEEIRHRIRVLAFRHSTATAFLFAHPTNATKVSPAHRTLMLSCHLGLPVYTDSLLLTFQHCERHMDLLGDHATGLCPAKFGRTAPQHACFPRLPRRRARLSIRSAVPCPGHRASTRGHPCTPHCRSEQRRDKARRV